MTRYFLARSCAGGVLAVAVTVSPVLAQPSSCPERETCTYYCPELLEAELRAPLDPELAKILTGAVHLPGAWKSFAKTVRSLGATLEPSVPADLARRAGLLTIYTIRWPRPQTPDQLQRAIKKLSKDERVKRVARVPMARPPSDPWTAAPGDPNCTFQWYWERANIGGAWACHATGNGVSLAVVDWGFAATHDELSHAYDATRIANVCDGTHQIVENAYTYHGAGSVGLIAAFENGQGIQGVAMQTSIWPIEASCVSDDFDSCDECWEVGNPWATGIAQVMTWSAAGQPRVILLEVETCCGGNYEGSIAVNAAVRSAIAAGIVVVIPAGNGNHDAGCDDQGGTIQDTGAIVVGATSPAAGNPLTVESNWGTRIVVSAPGEHLLTCGKGQSGVACNTGAVPSKAYTVDYGGTSGAAAIVAGVVALMLQKDPTLTPAQVRAKLTATGTPIGGTKSGGVFLDAGAAVAAASPNWPLCLNWFPWRPWLYPWWPALIKEAPH
jgi:subtilisin family serine protease